MESDAKKKAWVPASNIQPCHGCGVVGDKRKPCNTCQLRELMRKKHEVYDKATKARNSKILASPQQQAKKREVKKKDEDFILKMGLLRKAAVLFKSQRWRDAHKIILQAVKMVKQEKIEEKKFKEEQEKKLRTALQIPLDLEIDYLELTSEPITKSRLEKLEINVPIQKIEILVEKMCGKDALAYSKNKFLNIQIEELFEAIDYAVNDKKKILENIKKKVETLENTAEEAPQPYEESSQDLKVKKKLGVSTQMCEKAKNHEKCMDENCTFAHSAIELDLVSKETKIRNLKNTIKQSKEKLLKSRAIEPWRPAKSGFIESKDQRDMRSRGARMRAKRRSQSIKDDLMERDLDHEDFASSFENI